MPEPKLKLIASPDDTGVAVSVTCWACYWGAPLREDFDGSGGMVCKVCGTRYALADVQHFVAQALAATGTLLDTLDALVEE